MLKYDVVPALAVELKQPENYVRNVVDLLDEGSTIPFIARYRKEVHGSMDDTLLRKLEERLKYLRNLAERKEEILRAIEAQGKLTPELERSVTAAATLAEAEDLYRPYKQKRRTRASIAREKGLEPLAELLMRQDRDMPAPCDAAAAYIDPEKGVGSVEEALAGASDIVAERVSDSPVLRKGLRTMIQRRGSLESRAAEDADPDSVYQQYYAFSQPVSRMQGYQILALNRGEKEGVLKVDLKVDRQEALLLLENGILRRGSPAEAFLKTAVADGYDRLLSKSMETEVRSALTETAAEGAIANFALNLKPLLMQPPVKGKVTMGLDPGYRMGCKVAVVDPTGRVLDTTVVYPTQGERKRTEAIRMLKALVERHGVERIAIGNGTASRETEAMTAELLRDCPGVSYMVVSEAGASVYSASKLAAEEFPEYDVNLRSAVSIARRLQDPMAELVKIDPKSIGVGQYQHDMPQKRLDESLCAVVEDCVNAVGVDLNTASPSLLTRVSGLNGTIAKNIAAYREEHGAYHDRRELLKVPKLGPKAYQLCAGFLRVPESSNILDNTGVHPESYAAAEKLLALCGCSAAEVRAGGAASLTERAEAFGIGALARECGVGVPTLRDLIGELTRPGRDPRDELPAPIFRTDLLEIGDLKEGMELTGTVRNVIDFGAFVDIGVHQDGLVHISEIADRYIRHPSEVLSVGQDVRVVVLSVDAKRGRIGLSIRRAAGK